MYFISRLPLLITSRYITRKSLLVLSNFKRALFASASAVRELHKMQQVHLANDVSIPIMGLGTWKTHPDEMQTTIEAAIAAGYRHFDTAFNYNTEESLGNALERLILQGKVHRSELFITTKLPVFGNRASDVERFLTMSLAKLKMDYVDLYLIHMPFALESEKDKLQPAKNEDGSVRLDIETKPIDTWRAMEAEVCRGRTKSIGVSNFNIAQVRRLYAEAKIKPVILQVEVHAYHQQKQLRKDCEELNIAVTAYAPLGSPRAQSHFLEKYDHIREIPELLSEPIVKEIAECLNKTPGQILLKHLTQRGVIVIPKSVNAKRIKQNAEIFDFKLSEDHLQTLDALDRGDKGRVFDFMFFQGIEDHPEYPFAKTDEIQNECNE